MATVTEVVNVDWLQEIDGMTVADAITYLGTLDQTLRLNAYLDGDTHGCDIVANLLYERPETPEEEQARKEKLRVKRIKTLKKFIDYNIQDIERSRRCGQLDRIPLREERIEKYRAELAQLES